MKNVIGKVAEYKDKIASLEDLSSQQQSKTIEVVKLEQSLRNQNCQTCGASLPSEKVKEISERLDFLKQEVLKFEDVEELKYELKNKLKKLETATSSDDKTEKYKSLIEVDKQFEIDILGLENKIYEFNQSLQDIDEESSISIRKKYDSLNKNSSYRKTD